MGSSNELSPTSEYIAPTHDFGAEYELISDPIDDVVEYEDQQVERGFLEKVKHLGKRSLQWTIVGAELGPWNEAMRYIPYGAVLAATENPVISGLFLGGATMAIEGAAALATASLITSDSGRKVVNIANEKLEKYFKIKPDTKASALGKAGVAFAGGTVLNMALDQREHPERSTAETRKYGLKVSAALGASLGVMGVAGAAGIDALSDPKPIGVGMIALAGLYSAVRYIKEKVNKGVDND